MVVVVVVVGFRRRSEEACQVHFGNEPVSERAHVVHAVGSVVNLLQEVFQLLDENALFEPGCFFDYVLEEDESRIQRSLDLLQEVENLLVMSAGFSDLLGDERPQFVVNLGGLCVNVLLEGCG